MISGAENARSTDWMQDDERAMPLLNLADLEECVFSDSTTSVTCGHRKGLVRLGDEPCLSEIEHQAQRNTEIVLPGTVETRMDIVDLNRPEGQELGSVDIDASAKALGK